MAKVLDVPRAKINEALQEVMGHGIVWLPLSCPTAPAWRVDPEGGRDVTVMLGNPSHPRGVRQLIGGILLTDVLTSA
ncbi:hypothetical protein [Streptomyces sp. McG3]|uniref:hypothetical protein n=1 Tax=Streptomyces sp. McG3 TaxID=2725483 RepID=UPI0020372B9D|nr:hypothetical protein [Streptomyces sp. McG3]